jgi:hypothetical protein
MIKKRFSNRFFWTDQENSREISFPLYFLILEGSDVFFVNNTGRIINKVEFLSSQAEVCDATGACFLLFGPFGLYSYENVFPDEAVLLADIDYIRNDSAGHSLQLHAPYLRKTCLCFEIPRFEKSNRHLLLKKGDKRYKINYATDPELMYLPAVNRRT